MDQRREATRRTFASRRGLEGEIVDRSDVGGTGDTSNMRSMTAPAPEQMRALATATVANLSTEQRRKRMHRCTLQPVFRASDPKPDDPHEGQDWNWGNER